MSQSSKDTVSDGSALDRIFFAKRIAFIGASEKNRAALKILESNRGFGRGKEVFFVNPRRSTVAGERCYSSVADLPEPVECAVISVPSRYVVPSMREAVEAGTRGFVIHSAGFSENGSEGIEQQAQIVDLCESTGAVAIGPNCLGVVNFRERVAAYCSGLPADLEEGNVALIAQSGAAGLTALHTRRLGLSFLASTGNEAVVSSEDILEYCLEDSGTEVVALFLEQLRQPERFRELAVRAMRVGKPIVVLKVGLSETGGRVSYGHTGALVGSKGAHEAVFRDLGVIQTYDFDEFLETIEALSRSKNTPAGKRTAYFSISGGELALAADVADSVGLPMEQWSAETRSQMANVLGRDEASCTNPLDVGSNFKTSLDLRTATAELIKIASRDPSVDLIALGQNAALSLTEQQMAFYRQFTGAAADASSEVDKPVYVLSTVAAGFHPGIAGELGRADVPILQGSRTAIEAVRNAGWYGEQSSIFRSVDRDGEWKGPDRSEIDRILDGADDCGRLGEFHSKALLKLFGIRAPEEEVATSASEAMQAADRIGYPVVLKTASSNIIHKTDVGGVRLGLIGRDQVEDAYHDVVQAIKQISPGPSDGVVLVSKQVPPGVELILGMKSDPQFGPLVLFGMGGTLVELFGVGPLLVPPVSVEEAFVVVSKFPGSTILQGHRGSDASDTESIAMVLHHFSLMAHYLSNDLLELDANPVIVGPQGSGCWVVDASATIANSPLARE